MPEPQFTLLKPALIFLGSGSGGLLRYWLGGIVQNWSGPSFPFGTFVVNVTGCLAMGFLATAWTGSVLIREEYRSAVLIGVLGGYTTFSSFSLQTLNLAQDSEWLQAGGNVVASVVFCLLAVWLGHMLALSINAMKWI